MPILVDTSVWSTALRRHRSKLNDEQREIVAELIRLIREDQVRMIGPVRQEVLSGIREPLQFDRLKRRLRSFDDELLSTADFESAADLYNRCRALGVTASPIDSLICAVSLSRGWPVFTLDRDFAYYARVLSLELHATRPSG